MGCSTMCLASGELDMQHGHGIRPGFIERLVRGTALADLNQKLLIEPVPKDSPTLVV